ncbi:hypothetical protein EUGRSUZ_C01564 [Eucalyptus grandis]|uniref:Uncharacterized protein n=2 Tax=Eucalyptus grandis TaxID=71139 RepID=A0ACC3LDE6_EUCGR|nr:hypothetical protein EUGRSUZ_C01564 [Eucalyptus grandis]
MIHTKKTFFAGILWHIWKSRNAAIFQGRKPDQLTTRIEARTATELYTKRAEKGLSRSRRRQLESEIPTKWVSPGSQELQWNIDASWCRSSLAGMVAGVCRNAIGVLVDGFAKKIQASMVAVAESLALREVLVRVRERRSTRAGLQLQVFKGRDLKVCISSDNLPLVECVSGRAEPPWPAQTVVHNCKIIMAQLSEVLVLYEPRENNRAADWVAKAYKANSLPTNWVLFPP